MEMTWWCICYECLTCKKEVAIAKVSYSADGEIRILFYCDTCKETTAWTIYACQLQHRAMTSDIEKMLKLKKPTKQLPPAPVPPVQAELSEEDKKFLRDNKIDPGDKP